MEYIWTKKFVRDLALANRKLDNNTLYEVCSVEASYDKEETLALYSERGDPKRLQRVLNTLTTYRNG